MTWFKNTMELDQALEVFGLKIGELTPEIVQTRYRELAKKRHPDAGGTNESFSELQAAHEVLKLIGANGRFSAGRGPQVQTGGFVWPDSMFRGGANTSSRKRHRYHQDTMDKVIETARIMGLHPEQIAVFQRMKNEQL